ncbi:LytR/AlgR family response regulator transcription factor [Roseivirga misakiensis]|uniref:DNA-binding response regulator n=1 Tax=Roseivirga misakiensis TaxID=1563681 RepID=A0A1E5SZM8_9BACT|nr:response regulator transcription factor [Roseivirga misakiensis]OEK04565.1 DNA-binding response regulator [Roseivirga misakiensis]
MKIDCLIVDDEPLAVQLLTAHVNQVPMLNLIGTCSNAIEAMEKVKSEPVDLLFLDIQMPMLSGIDFLKSLDNPPKVIFTTAFREYAMSGYELDIVDYLLKPITFERFFKAINKYLKQIDNNSPAKAHSLPIEEPKPEEFLFVNVNKKHVKVNFQEIVYIESLKDYIKINLVDGSVITKDKISDFEAKLSGQFLRVHRSYIVNKQHITAFTAQDIELGRQEIPIGVSYKRIVDHWLKS